MDVTGEEVVGAKLVDGLEEPDIYDIAPDGGGGWSGGDIVDEKALASIVSSSSSSSSSSKSPSIPNIVCTPFLL